MKKKNKKKNFNIHFYEKNSFKKPKNPQNKK